MKVPVTTNRKLLSHYEKGERVCSLLSKCLAGKNLTSQSTAGDASLRKALAEQPCSCLKTEMSWGSLSPARIGVLPALAQGALTDPTGCIECA